MAAGALRLTPEEMALRNGTVEMTLLGTAEATPR